MQTGQEEGFRYAAPCDAAHCTSRRFRSRLVALSLIAGLTVLVPAAVGQQDARPDAADQGQIAGLLEQAMEHYNIASEAVARTVWVAEYQAAIAALTLVVERDPDHGPAHFLRALAHGQLAAMHQDQARLYRADQEPQAAVEEELAAVENYRAMSRDLDVLLARQGADRQASLNLIDGIVRVKLAGFTEGADRVAERARLLDQAADALRRYLNPGPERAAEAPTGFERLRGEYFLGVVLYRQALEPDVDPAGPDRLVDPAKLDDAADVMLNLVTPESPSHVDRLVPAEIPGREDMVRRWLSYPTLYLGLIRTRQGASRCVEAHCRPSATRYQEAITFFEQAWRLDTGEDYPSGRGSPGSYIPYVVERHLPALEEAMVEEPGYAEEFFIDVRTGFAYDTNVILLGDQTAVPRRLGRRRDVRFDTGLAMGYTLDLGKLTPELDRWTVGFVGRLGANWHGAISEFNEQNYGASVALQYRLLDAWQSDGVAHGPLYAAIQYDYDYFLLGNKGFLSMNTVSPRLVLYTFDQRAVTTLAFRYEHRNYMHPQFRTPIFDRDGHYYALSITQGYDLLDMSRVYKNLGWQPWGLPHDPTDPDTFDPTDPTQDTLGYQRWLRPYAGVEFGRDDTRGAEFDARRLVLAAGIIVPLPYGIDFDFGGEWEWQNYRGVRGGSMIDHRRRGRDDFIQRYSFGLERQFVLVPGHRVNRRTVKMDRVTMLIRADVQLIDNDSNVKDRLGQAIFSYDRYVYGLSVAFQFN